MPRTRPERLVSVGSTKEKLLRCEKVHFDNMVLGNPVFLLNLMGNISYNNKKAHLFTYLFSGRSSNVTFACSVAP